jgi:predicted DCC family thiol-disulfide oxidoreductase YuxK
MSDEYHPVLIYDADCGFCRWSVAKLLAWDRAGRLRLLTLQEPEASELLASVAPEDRMRSSHLVLTRRAPDGAVVREVHSGGEQVGPLLKLLPGGAPLAALARAVPPRVRDRAYRAVADNRIRVGKLVPAGARARADERLRRRRSR